MPIIVLGCVVAYTAFSAWCVGTVVAGAAVHRALMWGGM